MKKVLIIEDALPILEALRTKIEEAGFDVSTAKNGESGLSQALTSQPDLIILDIILPKMNGVTLLKKLREDSWGREVKLIILTNISPTDELKKLMQEGGYDLYIKTDIELNSFVEIVKSKLYV